MTRGMILAAGRGQRMGKMTEFLPKPLLHVAGRYLIEYAIDNLKQAGVRDIVINVSYRGDQIMQALGDGERYGVRIVYSQEKERLETGGGIFQALPHFGSEPFLVISCDIITDFSLAKLKLPANSLAHLLMVSNPPYHPFGDFALQNGLILQEESSRLTFASLGLFHPQLFAGCKPGHFRLTDVLAPAIKNHQVTGEIYNGLWYNVGTPEDLKQLSTNNLP